MQAYGSYATSVAGLGSSVNLFAGLEGSLRAIAEGVAEVVKTVAAVARSVFSRASVERPGQDRPPTKPVDTASPRRPLLSRPSPSTPPTPETVSTFVAQYNQGRPLSVSPAVINAPPPGCPPIDLQYAQERFVEDISRDGLVVVGTTEVKGNPETPSTTLVGDFDQALETLLEGATLSADAKKSLYVVLSQATLCAALRGEALQFMQAGLKPLGNSGLVKSNITKKGNVLKVIMEASYPVIAAAPKMTKQGYEIETFPERLAVRVEIEIPIALQPGEDYTVVAATMTTVSPPPEEAAGTSAVSPQDAGSTLPSRVVATAQPSPQPTPAASEPGPGTTVTRPIIPKLQLNTRSSEDGDGPQYSVGVLRTTSVGSDDDTDRDSTERPVVTSTRLPSATRVVPAVAPVSTAAPSVISGQTEFDLCPAPPQTGIISVPMFGSVDLPHRMELIDPTKAEQSTFFQGRRSIVESINGVYRTALLQYQHTQLRGHRITFTGTSRKDIVKRNDDDGSHTITRQEIISINFEGKKYEGISTIVTTVFPDSEKEPTVQIAIRWL